MKTIRIGSRKSPLALQQAHQVARKLEFLNYNVQIIPIDSAGDIDLVQPIYKMGITGVFTKNLDIALLNKEIDIAVHSLKDIPTEMPEGIALAAVLERDYPQDVIVWRTQAPYTFENKTIGTGSLRRQAFLKNNDSSVKCENIRGNIQTRIEKLNTGAYDAVVFSLAGLKRMEMELSYETLPFMIPAAGQGVVAITTLKGNFEKELRQINHEDTFRCIHVEREFLKTLEGGCSAPIGALAVSSDYLISFEGAILTVDGSQKVEIKENFSKEEYLDKGKELALKLKDLDTYGISEQLPNS